MIEQRKFYTKDKSAETQSILGRSLPANVEVERSVLGALLMNDEAIARIMEILLSDDFYLPAHKIIYQAMIDLVHDHKRIDLLTLQDILHVQKKLEAIGGEIYLVSLQENMASIGLIDQHANLVKEKSVLRSLINSATDIITNCYDQNEESIDAVLDEAEKTIFQISNKRTNQSFVQLNIWLKKTFQHLSHIKSNSKGITGVPAGYKKLDHMTSGFQKGDFVVLAARPSMGKTALALGMAAHAALVGIPVGFFSLEMSAEQLTLRLLSSESKVPHHNIRNATISSQEWVELTTAATQLG